MVPMLRYLGVDPQTDLKITSQQQFTGNATYQRFNNTCWAAIGSHIALFLARTLALLGLT